MKKIFLLVVLMIMVGLMSNSIAGPNYPSGLNYPVGSMVAYWNFDYCEGTLTDDVSGVTPAANGTVFTPYSNPNTIPPPLWVEGINNQCVNYKFTETCSGVDNDNCARYVNLGRPDKLNFNSEAMNNGDGFTISVWVKSYTDQTNTRQIFSKGYCTGGTQYQLKIKDKVNSSDPEGLIMWGAWYDNWSHNCWVYSDAASCQDDNPSTFLIKKDKWYFMVASYKKINSTQHEYQLIVYEDDDGDGTWVKHTFNRNDDQGITSRNADVNIGSVVVCPSDVKQYWWNGLIDEVGVFNVAFNQTNAENLFNSYSGRQTANCDDGGVQASDLVLWYDASDQTIFEMMGTYVMKWKDKTTPAEDAVPINSNMRPQINSSAFSSAPVTQNKRGVAFEIKYGANEYGYSDILTTSDIGGEIVSGETDKWKPLSTDKSLFIIFKTGNNIDETSDPDPYWSDGRQCIFEAGGPLSGYNVYISNGKICFGMWNRFERKFMVYNPPPGESFIYPLSKTAVYMAILEYDSENNEFRVGVTKYDDGPTAPPYATFSGFISFQGLTLDVNYTDEKIGIGGASRTAYADYSIGSTHSDHFAGAFGEILLYNKFFSRIVNGEYNSFDQYFLYNLYGYINTKFGTKFEYKEEFHYIPRASDWDMIEFSELKQNEVFMSTAYPNPFTGKSTFSVYLPEEQNLNVELFNALGQKVQSIYSGSLAKGIHDFIIDGNGLADGMYIFKVTGDGFVESGKVVITK